MSEPDPFDPPPESPHSCTEPLSALERQDRVDERRLLVERQRQPYEGYRRHQLKTDPEPFHALWHGIKMFEVRKNDRNFAVGDTLVLRELGPNSYTGRCILARISYIAHGGSWGLPPGLCVLGFYMSHQRFGATGEDSLLG